MGFDTADDAAVYRLNAEIALIQTVDFFPPMVDDPYTFGQIAAANALSDVYAMGGVPKLALNLLCFPSDKLPPEAVAAILAGGQDKVAEAGAVTCGGHTVEDLEPKYGLAVTGLVHPDKVLTNAGAKTGDLMILTKAIGSGILTTAGKAGMLDDHQHQKLMETMGSLNADAARIMANYPVHACTDITGFGLMGHASEMARGSGKSITLWANRLPLLPGAERFAQEGVIPGGLLRNRGFMRNTTSLSPDIPEAVSYLLFDPQTSGGLLISLPEREAEKLLTELQAFCPDARIVGRVEDRGLLDVKAI